MQLRYSSSICSRVAWSTWMPATTDTASPVARLVFSVSAQAEVMDCVKGTQGKVMLVTTSVSHPYQSIVDRTVVLPFLPPDPETCSVSPVLFDVFVELLVQCIESAMYEA